MTDRTEAMDALIAQDADLIDVKPVAWRYVRGNAVVFLEDQLRGQVLRGVTGWTEVPLYTRPPVDAALLDEVVRLRGALGAINKAVIDGRVCDDVAWFSPIETLHDFIEEVLHPSQPAAVGDLFDPTPDMGKVQP